MRGPHLELKATNDGASFGDQNYQQGCLIWSQDNQWVPYYIRTTNEGTSFEGQNHQCGE